jgi:subfamily B ATP-binding cassette protein MsbA
VTIETSRPPTNVQIAVRIARRYMAPRWRGLTLAFAVAAIGALLSAVLVDLLRPAINDLLVRPKTGAIWSIPIGIAAIAVARGLLQIGQSLLVNRAAAGVVGDVQVELYGKMMRADLARLRASHTGGFVSQVVYDTGLISDAASTGGVNLVQQALTLAGAVVVMFINDWRLALIVLLAGPLLAVALRVFLRQAIKAAHGAMRATSDLSTAMMEGLDGVRVVKMENREAYEEARVATVVAARQRFIVRGANARGIAAPTTESLTMIIAAAVLAYKGWRSLSGHPDVGAFFAFFGALLVAGQALRQVSNLSTVVSQGLAAGRRLFAALDVQPEVRDARDAPELMVTSGEIAFRGVSFSYGEAAPVLHDVTIEARRGETVALVGPSGAGKTTVLGLIPRFYDVEAGVVSIDGQDVRGSSLSSLRRAIALVIQEPFLFDDTIAANIAYSRGSATQPEIEAAARDAAAHDFIAALPEGYDTVVGEAGVRLSGGQRQRIAIARALLKNAPIILLDEATSALDTESEAQVQEALGRLMAGRTTLVIAHRLSTVRGADRIYVLEAGRVVEVGRHDDLIRAGGLYSRLAQSQDLAHLPGTDA